MVFFFFLPSFLFQQCGAKGVLQPINIWLLCLHKRERLYYIYIYLEWELSFRIEGSSRNRPIPKQVAGPCCPGRQLRFLSASLDIDDVISSAPSKENLILAQSQCGASKWRLWIPAALDGGGRSNWAIACCASLLLCTYLSVYIPFTRPLPIISIPGAQLLLLFFPPPLLPFNFASFLSLRKNGWKIDTYRSKERDDEKAEILRVPWNITHKYILIRSDDWKPSGGHATLGRPSFMYIMNFFSISIKFLYFCREKEKSDISFLCDPSSIYCE